MTADQLEALMQWVNARAMLAVEERETDEPCQDYVKNEEVSRTAMYEVFGFAEHILGFPVERGSDEHPAHVIKNGTK